MESGQLKDEIRRLAKERNALIMAHFYQRDEIQEIADVAGDSLAMAIEAAHTDRQVIVLCGVHFMAESAAILAPGKTVLLPRSDAGCPMADMVEVDALRAMKARLPGRPVVTYVNSSAAVKAESDICCTSANAVAVVNSLDAAEVILVPDRNLGRYIAANTDKKCYFWEGYCPHHDQVPEEDVLAAKQAHPDALFLAHPECRPQILAMADHVASTSGMIDYVRKSPAKKFILGTEQGILYRLRKENPDKQFIMPNSLLFCKTMKYITLEDVLACLQSMSPRVTVPPETADKARRALERMLAVPRD
ncbi:MULTISPECIES: quinolinate synthase NadA [Syntrophotalea]|jgi:quinolinate synthase|uniref:Quinolinate synthase n=1 Tax=Syntrophotalea acetylenica TaxID=29542 RepID=A0A1L3GFS6_SYNAC|nr:quinolinate synthase NadA [Syntrophotalea acetylenica]APG24777.1 quinolinate synthase [Syntrophotalea acetylenica]APG42832.1 quinolinate synthase [Syntrophotalea acetylenica]MDY0261662.1 quinolinate synthase NadA [Syntrophotalea acetylenica]